MEKTIHHGRNIKRFREVFGLKQEGLAYELGDDWDQRKVSALEQKEVVDDKILELVANALKVPSEAIKNFDADAAVSYINTFQDSSKGDFNYQCNFNPLDKLVELFDENKKLYERLLKEKEEKNELLHKLLDKLK
ncbi:helix-turn-helix transcriptional regulator [Chitinophagaceae bacterium 26-R-25]|nr:helix-turn-helix transcriptional regulator [Chitinophagaceae bacterium 26-R-25]